MEVNENILHKPSILQEKPSTEGYIAVVLPKFKESKSITEGLLTQKQYEEVMVKRINATTATSWRRKWSKGNTAVLSLSGPTDQCTKEEPAYVSLCREAWS